MFITNLVISNIVNRVNHCIIQATFSNDSEPVDCRDFTITIKTDSATEYCLELCVYNKRSNRLEDVQSMFSEELILFIMQKVILVANKHSNLVDHEVKAIWCIITMFIEKNNDWKTIY